MDRGGVGRLIAGDRGPSSQYDDDRLMVGLVGCDEAGDCAEGGVYGISPVRAVGEVLVVDRIRSSRRARH